MTRLPMGRMLAATLMLLAACGGDTTGPPPLPSPEGLRGFYGLTRFDGALLPVDVIVEDDTTTLWNGMLAFDNDSLAEIVRVFESARGMATVLEAVRYRKRGSEVVFSYGPPSQSVVSADTGVLTTTELTVRENYLRPYGTVARVHVATYGVPIAH